MAGGIYLDKRRGIYAIYYPWKGERLWFRKYFDGRPIYDRERAERLLNDIRAEVDRKTFDPIDWGKDKTILVPNAWKTYQEQCLVGRARYNDRERIFYDFIKPYFEKMTLAEIEEHHIQDWFSKLPKTYSPAYLNLIRVTLRGFLNFFAITRRKAMKFPKVKIPHKKLEWLTADDQQRVIEVTPLQHQPIIRFLIIYGCRVSEACSLRKTDIDWRKKEITFRDRKNAQDNVLPIVAEIEPYLRSTGIPVNLHHVFSTPRGLKYTRSSVYQIWVKSSEKAGVRVIPLKNGTRTSLACGLKNRGISTSDIARILGNSEKVVEESYARTTAERVGHLLGVRKQSAAVK